jgi:hypothetical protein
MANPAPADPLPDAAPRKIGSLALVWRFANPLPRPHRGEPSWRWSSPRARQLAIPDGLAPRRR